MDVNKPYDEDQEDLHLALRAKTQTRSTKSLIQLRQELGLEKNMVNLKQLKKNDHHKII